MYKIKENNKKIYSKNKEKILRMTLLSMLTCLEYISILFINFKISSGQGYINIADSLTFLISFYFNPFIAGLSAGISNALADLTLGYGIYAPFTFFIKFVMGLTCSLLIKLVLKFNKKEYNFVYYFVILISGILMILLYSLTDFILFNDNNVILINSVFNIIQIGVNSVLGYILFLNTKSIKTLSNGKYKESNYLSKNIEKLLKL